MKKVCFDINKISCGKFLGKIATANSQILNVEYGVEYPLCRRASRMKIKRKLVGNKVFKSYKTIASEMVKTGIFISKNISNISKINFSWNLTLIVFAVSIIQLPSRKGARYGFNVPKRYLKTKPKYEHDE